MLGGRYLSLRVSMEMVYCSDLLDDVRGVVLTPSLVWSVHNMRVLVNGSSSAIVLALYLRNVLYA